MGVELQHIGAGCNRTGQAVAWGRWLAYASHHAILLHDPQDGATRSAMLGHAAPVTALRWVSPAGEPALLLSGAADGELRLWEVRAGDGVRGALLWRCVSVLKGGHSSAVTSVASWGVGKAAGPAPASDAADPPRFVLASVASDGGVALWTQQDATKRGGKGDVPAESGGDDGAPTGPPSEPLFAVALRLDEGAQRPPLAVALCGLLGADGDAPGKPASALVAWGGMDGRLALAVLRVPEAGGKTALSLLAGPTLRVPAHDDWVRGIDAVVVASTGGRGRASALVATASADRTARVWELVDLKADGSADDSLVPSPDSAPPAVPDDESSLPAFMTRLAPRPVLRAVAGGPPAMLLRRAALLVGHEDWIAGCTWRPGAVGVPTLLTASLDRTMLIWQRDAETGLWLTKVALGDAAASSLGYRGCVWSPDGRVVAANGHSGALHRWEGAEEPRGDAAGAGADALPARWEPRPSPTGHTGAVVDCAWLAPVAPGALLTASLDQTTRVWARAGGAGRGTPPSISPGASPRWCEVARPQVHGHDLHEVAVIPHPTLPRYASCSEEKVIRIFTAPRGFTAAFGRGAGASGPAGAFPAASGATRPALGLSNRAVRDAPEGPGDPPAPTSGEGVAPPPAGVAPPLEEVLAGSTLWPEDRKLYGHVADAVALAADPSGSTLASAARAARADTARCLAWDCRPADGPLGGGFGPPTPASTLPDAHSLSAARLAWSGDGLRLASASRDRSVALFSRASAREPAGPYALDARVEKAHLRQAYDVCWAPGDDAVLSAARDGKITLWGVSSQGQPGPALRPLGSLPQGRPVRAAAFAPRARDGLGLVALGLEDGTVRILVVRYRAAEGRPDPARSPLGQVGAGRLLWESSEAERHAAAVRRVAWGEADGEGALLLATCGEDHAARVFRVGLPPELLPCADGARDPATRAGSPPPPAALA